MLLACQCRTVTLPLRVPRSSEPARPLRLYHCHCTECRKQSGSAFGTSVVLPADAVFPLPAQAAAGLGVWTRPAGAGGSGRTMDCYFCKTCGVRLVHRTRGPDGTEADAVTVQGGCVEVEEGESESGAGLRWKGAMHIWTRSAVVDVPEGVVRWERGPGEGDGDGDGDGNGDGRGDVREEEVVHQMAEGKVKGPPGVADTAEELEEVERASPVCWMRV